jgi:hypothetical protein
MYLTKLVCANTGFAAGQLPIHASALSSTLPVVSRSVLDIVPLSGQFKVCTLPLSLSVSITNHGYRENAKEDHEDQLRKTLEGKH